MTTGPYGAVSFLTPCEKNHEADAPRETFHNLQPS